MKINSYDMLIRSLVMDIRKGNDVCFLFGSAISLPDNGVGMPSVDEMVDIIKQYLSQYDDDGMDDYLSDHQGSSRYQTAFEYLLAIGSQEDVKNILEIAVNRAKDTNGEWILPKAIKDFAELVLSGALKVKNILTTNFDPFIEESLKNGPYDINRIELTEDLTFDNGISHNNDRINIIHLHGYFEGDTMHTPDQLTTYREESIACIKKIIGRSKLYIIGYGGWDDIINQTLTEIVNEKRSNYDVRWAYFSHDENKINENNKDFFSSLNSAQLRSRFNAYSNVDCKVLFEEVNKKSHGVYFNVNDDTTSSNQDESTSLITLSDIYKPQPKPNVITLKEFPSSWDPSHDLIRLNEQEKTREYLRSEGSLTLVSGFGYGRLEFAASVLKDENPDYKAFRIDCSEINTKEEAHERFLRDIGVDFTTLVATRDNNNLSVIFFDNISEPSTEVISYFNEIISILKDYEGGLKGIFFTNRKLNLQNKTVELQPLNLADINEYIRFDLKCRLTSDELKTIAQRSSGLPIKLDKLKEYFSITSISHVLSSAVKSYESEPISLIDSIPKNLLSFITELSKAESDENKRVYSLLQVLCVVECGETPENIMKQFYAYHFKLDDFLRLVNNGLIYSVKISDTRDFRVNRVNPIIKDYVRSQVDETTLSYIRKEAIKMVSGDIWHNKSVVVSRTTRVLLDNIDFQPGNAHILITEALKNTSNEKDHATYCDAAVSYAFFLERNCRYQEAVSFVNEVISYFSEERGLSYYRLIDYLAESMRMLDRDEDAIEILENALSTYDTSSPFYRKATHESMSSCLLLAYSKCDKEKAYLLAEQIKKKSDKNTYRRFLSESILALKLDNSEKIDKLRKIEKRARNYKEVTIANNISLDLAVLDPSSTKKYISTVLASEKSDYTMVRATLKKIEGILSDPSTTSISSKDLISLSNCYRYLFLQRIDGLFNRCHSLLWKALLLEKRFDELFDVFLSSSLVWRVSGRIDKEIEYSKEIINVLTSNAYDNQINIAYLYRRSNALSLTTDI
ncbi:SIR2 family protein [uncultured Enterobacter sp.]|uniref:SIR2 family protein n=1 Tax=uncultured Enterobacter sp. TaxID=238202 RepID=UPI00258E578C|nr:SIR2 family protein [uncultured Enterobacter sp.]